MDIQEAIRLLEAGRLEDLDLDVLWEIEEALATGLGSQGYYIQFKNIVSGQNPKFPAFVQAPLAERSLAFKQVAEANVKALKGIEKEVNLFATDDKGNIKNPEAEAVFNFYRQVQIENKSHADKVTSEDFFRNLNAMAVLDAHEKIYLTPRFAEFSKEEQIKAYENALLMSLQETAFILASNQEIEDREVGTAKEIKPRAIEDKLSQIMSGEEGSKLKISNRNLIGTLSAGMNRLRNSARRLSVMTDENHLTNEIKAVDIQFIRSYPDNYPAMKPLSRGMGVSFIAGPVGRSSYGAWKISSALHKETGIIQKDNLFSYIRKQPSFLKILGHKLAKSISQVITTILCAKEAGMINDTVARNWKSFSNLLKPRSNSVSAQRIEARFNTTLASINAKTEFAVAQEDVKKTTSLLKEIARSRIGQMFCKDKSTSAQKLQTGKTAERE